MVPLAIGVGLRGDVNPLALLASGIYSGLMAVNSCGGHCCCGLSLWRRTLHLLGQSLALSAAPRDGSAARRCTQIGMQTAI